MLRRCLPGLLLALPLAAQAPPHPSLEPTASVRLRYEEWSWFDPGAAVGPGANQYGYGAVLGKAGLRFDTRRWMDATVELQSSSLLGLPTDARGPAPIGEMGAGAAHYTPHQHASDTRLFLNQAFVTLKTPARGPWLRLGRLEYTDGAEAPGTEPTLEWLRRARIAGRLVANFGFSHVQRTFDGASAGWDAAGANLTLVAVHPRQGGFELDGWRDISAVDLAGATLTLKPALLGAGTEARLFGFYYADRRSPADSVILADNRPALARAADSAGIRMPMVGGHLLRTQPVGRARLDLLLWGVYQAGDWGAQRHRAWALAAEGGIQLERWPGRPWVRAGYDRSSGDAHPQDGTHGTFFQALTTVRPFAQFPFYNLMNTEDAFVQLLLRPVPGRLTVRADLHRVRLAQARDLWYGGSGVFQRRGSFGFGGRPSAGARDLATVADLSVDWAVRRWCGVYAYAGHAAGGAVVRGSFAGDQATLAYLELTLRRP